MRTDIKPQLARRFDTALAEEAVAEQFYRFEPYLRKAVQASLLPILSAGVGPVSAA